MNLDHIARLSVAHDTTFMKVEILKLKTIQVKDYGLDLIENTYETVIMTINFLNKTLSFMSV